MSRRPRPHGEHHQRTLAWLRAVVLGADDGIVSVASILIGVASSPASRGQVLTAGIAGLVAGAASMAAGEYVSVSSQADAEAADVEVEKKELKENPSAELEELAGIYHKRGLTRALALEVAQQLTERDRLGAHLRDELGINERSRARPVLAAASSAASFALAAAVPMLVFALSPLSAAIPAVAVAACAALVVLGALGGWLGGAPVVKAALRVLVGGGLAMALTATIGKLVGFAGL